MCGRTVCSLGPDKLQKACSRYDDKSKKYTPLKWQEEDKQNAGKSYQPSYNICPTDVTPVIIAQGNDRVITPMLWGMIPPWHKGNYKDHKLSTNNCRIETILESRLYKTSMVTGRRCVVVCDGFYEWQTTKGEKDKQPYFIYSPQQEEMKIDEPETWRDSWSESEGWGGPKLLYMAALYNIWTSPEGDKFWSYSVVTLESDTAFGWLHHRVPAILDSESTISEWLGSETDPQTILNQLVPNRPLQWHPVSSTVNNSRDKSIGLNRAIDISKRRQSKSASFMDNWLKGSKRKRDNEDNANVKRDKKEEN